MWLTPCGLKCDPVDMHPLVTSPFSWTWKPWGPSVRPDTTPVIVTGPPRLAWINVTLPLTWPGPLRTTMALRSCYTFKKEKQFKQMLISLNKKMPTQFIIKHITLQVSARIKTYLHMCGTQIPYFYPKNHDKGLLVYYNCLVLRLYKQNDKEKGIISKQTN